MGDVGEMVKGGLGGGVKDWTKGALRFFWWVFLDGGVGDVVYECIWRCDGASTFSLGWDLCVLI